MATLDEEIATLRAAITGGLRRVRYGDKETEYHSLDEMQRALDRLVAERDAGAAVPPARVVRTYAGRGT